jgi:hypothetical protein
MGTASLAASLLSTLRDGYGWVVHWSGSNATTFTGRFLKIEMKLSSRSLEAISKIIRITPSYYRTGTSIYQWTWRLSLVLYRKVHQGYWVLEGKPQPTEPEDVIPLHIRSLFSHHSVCSHGESLDFWHIPLVPTKGLHSFLTCIFGNISIAQKRAMVLKLKSSKTTFGGIYFLAIPICWNTPSCGYPLNSSLSAQWSLSARETSICTHIQACLDPNGCLAAFFYSSGVDHTIWV